jgi:hypothetical protein
MNQEEKLKNQRDLEQYLEEKRVYDVFEDLMKNLMVKRPERPINFLIDYLKEQERNQLRKFF